MVEENEPKPVRIALALAVAQVATDQGLPSWALDAACRVLSLEAGHPEAIAIAEMHAPDVERGLQDGGSDTRMTTYGDKNTSTQSFTRVSRTP